MGEDWSDGGIDAAWDAWRTRALNALMIALCILALPAAMPGFLGEAGLPPKWRVLGPVIYAMLLANAVCVGWGFRTRTWITVAAGYVAAALALANRGLFGYGRVLLAVYPFGVTLLLGSRAGWSAVALSLGVYGTFTVLAYLGILDTWKVAVEDPNAPTLWLLQGVGLVLAIVPTMILVSRFRAHHMRAVRVERQVSRQLQDEVARRAAAHASLDQEHAKRLRLEEKIAQLGEAERRHLGREIHDGLCQQLTAALLRCTALQEQLSSRQASEAAQAARLRTLIQEMLDGAYVISKGVWPVGPEPDGLIPALQALARRTADEFGLACEFRQRGQVQVRDGQMAMHLYRIAQEAVSNAVKHARASRISLALVGSSDRIALNVSDNGRGPSGAANAGGMGLSIMAYRARSIGGTLTITDAESGGTLVCCSVPCAGAGSTQGAHHHGEQGV